MGSLSDWEAVDGDDDDTSTNTSANLSNDEDGDDHSNETAAVVLVELPPEGITNSTRTNLNHRKEEQGSRCHPQDGSTTSSFSMVRRVGELNLGQVDSSFSGSESCVSGPSSSATTHNTTTTYAYSRCASNTSGESTEGVASSGASLTSEFDILTLSGKTVKRCRNCKFHNNTEAILCLVCGLALVANPNLSMDEQIAVHLQQKEEEAAAAYLQEEENKKKRIMDDPIYSAAAVLGKDIRDLVSSGKAFDTVQTFATRGYECLEENDQTSLAMKFIDTSRELRFPKVSFAYKVSSKKALKRIVAEGFAAISPRRFGGEEANGYVHVSHTLKGAIETFRRDGEALHGRHDTLFPIPEHSTERNISDSLGWIVAISECVLPSAESARPPFAGLEEARHAGCAMPKMVPSSGRVLPLICFDTNSVDGADVDLLLEGLEEIFQSFFVHSLQMVLGPRPPAPKKMKRVEPAYGHSNDRVAQQQIQVPASPAPAIISTDTASSAPGVVQNIRREDPSRRLVKAACSAWVISASPSKNGTLASAHDDKNIYVWSEVFGVYATLEGHTKHINALAFGPPTSLSGDGTDIDMLASGDQSGYVKVWDTTRGTKKVLLLELNDNARRPILDLRFFPSGKTLAAVDWNRECLLWKLSDGTCTCRLQGHRPERRQIALGKFEHFSLQAAAFSPDGQSVASVATTSPFVYFWQFNGNKKLLAGHRHSTDAIGREEVMIRALVFSPDGLVLASAANDRTIRLWKPRSSCGANTCYKTIENLPQPASCLIFSPNGKQIASGDGDGAVRLWDTETGEELASFSGHEGPVKSVAFFKDGKTLVSSGQDCTMRCWKMPLSDTII